MYVCMNNLPKVVVKYARFYAEPCQSKRGLRAKKLAGEKLTAAKKAGRNV